MRRERERRELGGGRERERRKEGGRKREGERDQVHDYSLIKSTCTQMKVLISELLLVAPLSVMISLHIHCVYCMCTLSFIRFRQMGIIGAVVMIKQLTSIRFVCTHTHSMVSCIDTRLAIMGFPSSQLESPYSLGLCI